ncbi:MAG: prephenate dehydratase [Clostridiales bacterium]|nr:prephenate dehydratase [Clostridiales bacterium]
MRKIGYLGPAGTFTEQAALVLQEDYPGKLVDYRDVPSLIMAVQDGALDLGVAPIENVIEGTVNVTIDMLAHDVELKIIGERTIAIHQCLVAKPGVRKEDILQILSHPQALAQCRRFLHKEFPGVPVHSTNSTAAGAREAKDSIQPVAAIANKRAADIFGLNILHENIEDHPNNCTRFVVLSRNSVKRTGKDKTSIVFSVNDEPGSLLQALDIFASWGINLTRIESRPMRTRLGQYLFYVDFEGHAEDEEASRALSSVQALSTYYKHLGSYPRWQDDIE